MSSTPFVLLVMYGLFLNSSLHCVSAGCVVTVGQQIGQLDDSERQAIGKKVDELAKALDTNRLSDRDKANDRYGGTPICRAGSSRCEELRLLERGYYRNSLSPERRTLAG